MGSSYFLFFLPYLVLPNEFNSTWNAVQLPSPPVIFSSRSGVGWLPQTGNYSVQYLYAGHNSSSLYGHDTGGGGPINEAWRVSATLKPQTSWTKLSAPVWGPRSCFALAHSTTGKRAILVGGSRPPPSSNSSPLNAILLDDVWSTPSEGDGAGEVWTEVAPTGHRFLPVHAHALLHFQGKFWLLGGFTGSTLGSANASSGVWSTTDGGTWSEVDTSGKSMWGGRGFHGAAAFQNSLWVCCGSSGGETGALWGDVWMSADSTGKSWLKIGDGVFAGSGRAGATMWVSASPVSTLWLFGGQLSPLLLPTFNTSTSKEGPAVLGSSRGMQAGYSLTDSSSSSSSSQNQVLFSHDVWRYIPAGSNGGEWELVDSHPPWSPRAGISVIPCDVHPPSLYPSTCAALPTLLGGLEGGAKPGSLPSPAKAPVFTATPNLLCQSRDLVCTGRGFCLARYPLVVTLNCTCEGGYSGSRCEETTCSKDNCNPSHGGLCLALGTGASAGAPTCVCSDDDNWAGYACNDPVCYPGCSAFHGSCTEAPGACFCEQGWAGEFCSEEESAFERWVTEEARGLYLTSAILGFIGVSVGSLWLNSHAFSSVQRALLGGLGGERDFLRNSYLRSATRTTSTYATSPEDDFTPYGGHGGREMGGEKTPLLASNGRGAPKITTAAASNQMDKQGKSEILFTAALGASPPPKPRVRFSPRLERYQGDDDNL